jgi:hypothetical protein
MGEIKSLMCKYYDIYPQGHSLILNVYSKCHEHWE